jgi:hypothetical protein
MEFLLEQINAISDIINDMGSYGKLHLLFMIMLIILFLSIVGLFITNSHISHYEQSLYLTYLAIFL